MIIFLWSGKLTIETTKRPVVKDNVKENKKMEVIVDGGCGRDVQSDSDYLCKEQRE